MTTTPKPCTMPEEKIPTFAQISGGRTSGYMAKLLQNQLDTFFMFQNTGREKPETYEFLERMDMEFGLNLLLLEYWCPDPTKKATYKLKTFKTLNKEGLPFSQLIEKRKAIPNKFKRFCSAELKVKTARRWIRDGGYLKWKYALGYRADETRSTHSDTMQKVITPLKDKGITSRDVGEFWKGMNFDLNLPMMPNGKTFGGNCMGCFWHSEYQNAHLCKNHPDQVKWLIEQEEKHGHTFNTGFSFKELSEKTRDMPQGVFDLDDALCQSTNGSCGT